MNLKRRGDRSVFNSSPPYQTRFINCGDNNSAYIEPINAPPFANKYKESRVIDLTIGFIDGKVKKFMHSQSAIKEKKCIPKFMTLELSLE